MQLALKSETWGEVVVVRCCGRIVTGEEARLFQSELDKLTQLNKNVVLNLAEISYLDSGGLGTLVRMLGRLRAARGDLKLCQVPSFVEQALNVTNLLGVFHPYPSEKEAIEAFPCVDKDRRSLLALRTPELSASTLRSICLRI